MAPSGVQGRRQYSSVSKGPSAERESSTNKAIVQFGTRVVKIRAERCEVWLNNVVECAASWAFHDQVPKLSFGGVSDESVAACCAYPGKGSRAAETCVVFELEDGSSLSLWFGNNRAFFAARHDNGPWRE